MREISLHILDILQNSIAVGASRIEVVAEADHKKDLLEVTITDNGRGMPAEMVEAVMSPFVTTRSTRRVGLGLPMLKAAAEACEGRVKLTSTVGVGTEVSATFRLSHIDRAPFGDIWSTMLSVIVANPETDFRYEQVVDGKSFYLDMADVRRELGDVPIQSAPVIKWLRGYFAEGVALVGMIS
jgi:hypothetical protein